jgi:uncharacterized secreted protein with C-terminal beta-propeller domain
MKSKGESYMKKSSKIIIVLLILTMALTLFQLPQTDVHAQSDLPTLAQGRLQDAVVLYIGSSEAYVNNSKSQIDASNPEVTAISKNNRTLIPVRFVAESLGAKVDWEEKSSTVTMTFKGKILKLVLGSNKLQDKNTEYALEAPAEKINNRTYIPLRAVTEAFGKKVFYDRGLIIISSKDKIFDTFKEKGLVDEVIAKVNNLPVVGSKEKLEKLLSFSKNEGGNNYYVTGLADVKGDTVKSVQSANMENAKAKEYQPEAGAGDYSKTNVQVDGVDEADVVKTDGKYIYQVKKEKLVVAEVYPAESMKVVAQLDFTDKSLTPSEIYVDGNHLVVIGQSTDKPIYRAQGNAKIAIMPQRITNTFTKAIVYDITNKEDIKQLRELEIEGNYLSSRKIGSSLYLVTNKNINYYYIQNEKEELTPAYMDSIAGNQLKYIDYNRIRYFPGCQLSNYLVIAGINLDNSEEKANVYSYLGSGQNIYASENNLYVAVTKYEYNRPMLKNSAKSIIAPVEGESTLVYKFSINDSKITYLCKGEVPGRILNQFSMDESNGYFRIATTKGQTWGSLGDTSKNNIYILNDTMNIAGKLEDLAPGERIYSVRFMGEKAYVVTFKQVDPLFVIDLTPEQPKVLGALKIPGYSDYLQPYDENHIIGFGKDTTELKDGNAVLMQGMKMALFDVTDVSRPKELFKEVIGDRGTDSELLRNHKALLFSKEKNLLAFPVTVVENKSDNSNTTFQGAYIYNIDLQKGFTLRKKVTHITDEEYLKAGYYWYNSESNIQRILYIKDVLYTLSESMIKAFEIKDLKEINTLIIK